MMKIYKWGFGATALALVLSACSENSPIQFPGLSKPDEEVTTTPAPPPPVDETDTPVEQPDTDVPTGDDPDVGTDTPADPTDETDPTDTDPVDPTNPTDSLDTDPTDPDTGETPDTVPDTPTDPVDTDPVDTGTDETGDTPDTDAPDVTPDTDPEPPVIVEPTFSYHPPGGLLAGSGSGAHDEVIYSPDMTFPIKDAPAYPQSMVWGFGGGIGGGDECDTRNYQYPWRDNFCETRSRDFNSPYCPVPKVHLGQDIRVGTSQGCNQMRNTPASERALYKVVAVEDGVISNIGSYTVNIRAGSRIYRYMHMNMRALQISLGDTVTAGQTLGYVSKDFGGHATTFHLHFEIKQNTAEQPWAYVPPYTSLVAAYERREGGPGERIETGDVAVAAAPIPIPEGFIFSE